MSKEVKAANLLLRLEGKRAVVVGGTSGIGRGIAERLAKAGSDVTIVGRESRRSQEVMAGLEPRNDEQKFAFVKCNCFLLSEVNKCVEKLLDSSEERGIDYLVMTHGMATIQGFTPSEEEGLDQKLALHVYSRAAFAKGLLPALEKSDDGRILSVLSAGIHSAYIGYKTDPELCNGGYSIKNAADAGGFYNDIFLDSLSRENSNVAFFHAAPGFVNTNWGTEMPSLLRMMIRGLQWMGRSKEDCAEYMISGFMSKVQGGFHLLDQYGAETAKPVSLHEEAREFVWDHIQAILAAGKSIANRK